MLIAQDTVLLTSVGLDSLREAVFKKYNVTEELYKTTLDYYNQDTDRWENFFDKVIAHVESLSQPSPTRLGEDSPSRSQKERAF